MSGPIVRSGPSSQYARNWESAFAGKPAGGNKKKAASQGTEKRAPKKKK